MASNGIWKIQSECFRRQIPTSPAWSVLELRTISANDKKMSSPETGGVPKRLTGMTLEELRTAASELGLEVGSTENKGAIMLLIRNHVAPDLMVLTLGRFKGSRYTEIPDLGLGRGEAERCLYAPRSQEVRGVEEEPPTIDTGDLGDLGSCQGEDCPAGSQARVLEGQSGTGPSSVNGDEHAADTGANYCGVDTFGPSLDDLTMHHEHYDPGSQHLAVLRTEDLEGDYNI